MRKIIIKRMSMAFIFTLLVCLCSAQTENTLIIEGNNIWVREFPKTGKVVFTLDDGTVCKVLEKGEKQVIRGNQDFWYKIEHEGKAGWVFGSQSNIKQKASFDNFKPFLDYFLQTCYWGNNLDSLIHFKSKVTGKFIHSEIGFTRLYNPGAACIPYDYEFYDNERGTYFGVTNKKLKEVSFFPQQEPKDGFCDESQSPDGVYYTEVKALPKYPEFYEEYEVKEIEVPAKYKNGQKIIVYILLNGWISKTMCFMAADDKWWLVVIDDCDCSA